MCVCVFVVLHNFTSCIPMRFPDGSVVKNLLANTWFQSLGWEDSLEKEMATSSSILAWEIPWTEEPGRPTVTGATKSQM